MDRETRIGLLCMVVMLGGALVFPFFLKFMGGW